MTSIRNGWVGLGLFLAGSAGLLAACSAQGETQAVQQSALVGIGGIGAYLHDCASPPPVYPVNRVQGDEKVGCPCTTTSGVVSQLSSRCSANPATCGWLYCGLPPTDCPMNPEPSYPGNRVEKKWTKEGCDCFFNRAYPDRPDVEWIPGHTVSMCQLDPSTCDYLYCMPNFGSGGGAGPAAP